jgi:hypothetical protein
MDEQRKIKFNKCLEETCGLLNEISNMIIFDFSNYLHTLSSLEMPKKEKFKDDEVIDEEKNFIFNINLYNDSYLFLKGCFEIYNILVKQLEEMIFPSNENLILIQYISRARLNISNLIFTAKNEQLKITNDQKLVEKRLEIMEEINKKEMLNDYDEKYSNYYGTEKVKKIKRKAPLPKFDYNYNDKEKINTYVDLTEKIRRQFVFKVNEEKQKKIRLNAVLNR